jgi:hypothetical protein
VALGAGDISLEMISSNRTQARQELLARIDEEQRFRVVLDKLAHDAANVHAQAYQ